MEKEIQVAVELTQGELAMLRELLSKSAVVGSDAKTLAKLLDKTDEAATLGFE
jgi:hypothetical protein